MRTSARDRPLGIASDARYRTVAEAQIIELLLLHGWVHELRAGRRAEAACEARAALDHLIALGLPWRGADGEHLFDPAEVVNFLKCVGLRSSDPVWLRSIDNGRRLVLDAAVPTNENDASATGAVLRTRRFLIGIERTFHLEHCTPGTSVRLRLPVALEDDTLSALSVTPVVPSGVKLAVGEGRVDAIVAVPADGNITLGVQMAFRAHPGGGERAAPAMLPLAERDLYTRFREGVIEVTPRIAALAVHLAGEADDPWTVAGRFWDHLLDSYTCGVMHYHDLGASPLDWVLDTGWYDCHLGSALMVALCRARAIPARLVSGYLLYPASPIHHFWLEVWTRQRGWTPFDLLCWDLSAGGRDAQWRDRFRGHIDYRMKTQSLPRRFTGTPWLRFPVAWHLLGRATPDGTEIGFYDAQSGAPLYLDRIRVQQFDDSALAV